MSFDIRVKKPVVGGPLTVYRDWGIAASPTLDDDQKTYFQRFCLQVEILVDGVTVDSIDTHCHDRLCACCSTYFCHR